MKLKLEYKNIPTLAIGFTRADDLFGKLISYFSKSKDKGSPTHAFIVTEDHGQLFATEETAQGLRENTLETYTALDNRIVCMYYWKGFDDRNVRENVMRCLAETRRRAGENSLYDFAGLLSFVPFLKIFFKPDPKKQWCSENCASIMKMFGATWIHDTCVTPLALMNMMRNTEECEAVLNYYQ